MGISLVSWETLSYRKEIGGCGIKYMAFFAKH